MSKKGTNKIKINESANSEKTCTMCNPSQYLKFCFAYISYESSEAKSQDLIKMWERMKWMSENPYHEMSFKYQGDKKLWFESIPIKQINKEIPNSFRKIFPTETNEHYSVMRVYPAGRPKGTANPRIIGMIKHTIFYIFYLDWDGTLYEHGK